MANLNRVFLIGNLTRDPELKYVPRGTAVSNLGLAVNNRYKDQNGELKESTCFVRIVVWGKQAENCNQYLSKGSPIFVEGELQSRSWESQDGQKRSVIEVRARRIQFLGRPASKRQDEDEVVFEEGSQVDNSQNESAAHDDQVPF